MENKTATILAINGTATNTKEGKSKDSTKQETGDGALENKTATILAINGTSTNTKEGQSEDSTNLNNKESGKLLFNKVVLGDKDEVINHTSTILEDSAKQGNDTGDNASATVEV